jgi:hypothetical protein
LLRSARDELSIITDLARQTASVAPVASGRQPLAANSSD